MHRCFCRSELKSNNHHCEKRKGWEFEDKFSQAARYIHDAQTLDTVVTAPGLNLATSAEAINISQTSSPNDFRFANH
jgi:hypothetical protein